MRKAGLEQEIEASQGAAISLPKPERSVELIQDELSTLGFDTRLVVLEMLDVTVCVDGHNVEAIGAIPVSDYVTATPQTGLWGHNNVEVLPFSVGV